MDGNRDRPPGKTAENWGRRDGIRAGAVSGPWRSVPRDPVAGPPPVTVEELPPEEGPSAGRARRPLPVAAWVAIGCGVAAAFLTAAWLFGSGADPEPVAETPAPPAAAAPEAAAGTVPGTDPAPQAATAPSAAPAAVAEAPPPGPDPLLATIDSVRLRVPEAMRGARRAAIVAALQQGGVDDVRVEALPFEIETARVGYYLPDDRAAAEALARMAGPALGLTLPVRDYGKLLDDPTPGRLDLWLGK